MGFWLDMNRYTGTVSVTVRIDPTYAENDFLAEEKIEKELKFIFKDTNFIYKYFNDSKLEAERVENWEIDIE